MDVQVKELDKVFRGLGSDEEIVGWETLPLTKVGENYGSIILRILLKIENKKSGLQRTLDTAAKTVPTSEEVRKVFNTDISFKNEFLYYDEILPILDEFIKSKGIQEGADFSVPFYGGRLSLTDQKVVDDDAVILMQNLKSAGYVIGEKYKGLGLEESKLVLDALAKLHTSSLAIKLQDNGSFQKRFVPNFYNFMPSKEMVDIVTRNVTHYVKALGFNVEEVEVVKKALVDRRKENISPLWGTMIHYDSWVNNMLIKYNEQGKPIHSVLVDFQFYDYGSPLNDVAFFILSSIQQDNYEQSVDILLDYYYEKFVQLLEKFDVDTSDYTRFAYEKEVAFMVKNYEYWHTMWMSYVMFNKELHSVDELLTTGDGILPFTKEHLDRIRSITRLCFDKGWL